MFCIPVCCSEIPSATQLPVGASIAISKVVASTTRQHALTLAGKLPGVEERHRGGGGAKREREEGRERREREATTHQWKGWLRMAEDEGGVAPMEAF